MKVRPKVPRFGHGSHHKAEGSVPKVASRVRQRAKVRGRWFGAVFAKGSPEDVQGSVVGRLEKVRHPCMGGDGSLLARRFGGG
ncbi:hypothetical protein E3N88_42582 [Mikania micrantha]|uniref:Uncharacterized protein n=1 Tax=Mikania micrantha TaxID=192012 RepID=A0A5N6LHG8_9ASTR|nr:hypothetical protein E3N88_42582 [Mikania micrantha]